MALQVGDTRIQRVLIIDDDENVRSSYEDPVIDCDLEPRPEVGPIQSLQDYVSRVVGNGVQAAICDHHLKKHDYSNIDGAELIAELYRNQFPALLCTKWGDAQPEEIRRYRRFIPVMLSPEELDPDSICNGFQVCVKEFAGEMTAARKPWRSLVRIEDFDPEDVLQQRIYVVVPSWNPNHVINLMGAGVPEQIRNSLQAGTNRVFANVNIGAETESELFFEDWEAV